jgi:hypothetical protein
MFSYEVIGAFLKSAKLSYGVFPLGEYNKQSGVILRHDVDLDPKAAYDLAKVEVENDVLSSFFFLVTGNTYNVQSMANRKILKDLDSNKFEIGLHFDPTIYPDADHKTLTSKAVSEARSLEDIIGRRVRSVSLHNPSVHGQYPLFDGWKNAYDSEIFGVDRYLSDSRMIFRSEPNEFLRKATNTTVQLLLHPEHYSESGEAYPAPMLRYLESQSDLIYETFKVNSTFMEKCGKDFHKMVSEASVKWANDREPKP